MADGDETVYRIDGDDCIVFVNEAWRRFAQDNGGANLVNRVLGTSIWAHIRGPEVAQLYRTVFDAVRNDRRSRLFPFRCDSPAMQRHMIMRIAASADRGVALSCRTVMQVPRPPIALLDADVAHSDSLLRMCAWCKRVDGGEWLEVEDAIWRLRLFDAPRLPSISHGICPSCRAAVMAELDGSDAKERPPR